MRRHRPRIGALAKLAAALPLLCPTGARAAAPSSYKIQPIVQFGATVGTDQIPIGGFFATGALNDNDQLDFCTQNLNGGGALILYDGSRFIPLASAGLAAPTPEGKWPTDLELNPPRSVNRAGNAVFTATAGPAADASYGTFFWDYKAQRVTALALRGSPAVNGLTFAQGGGNSPVLNNQNVVAFPASIPGATGDLEEGIFLQGPDGKPSLVALQGQSLADGSLLGTPYEPDLNDAGLVTFLTFSTDGRNSAYLWQNGTLHLLAAPDQDTPGGGKIGSVFAAQVNNKNQNVLLLASSASGSGAPDSLYLWSGGTLTLLTAPGSSMPGGGTLSWIQPDGVSAANDLGQHVILARIDDAGTSRTAAYLMDADGTLSLILRSGTMTEQGEILDVGEGSGSSFHVGLNNNGHVALTLLIDGLPDTLALLIPSPP